MTPHFTIRVWGGRVRELLCDIEVDTTEGVGALSINNHRGLELIPQKMLTRGIHA